MSSSLSWLVQPIFIKSGRGIPETVEYLAKGTIESPCPPRTKAVISSTETLNSCDKKYLNLALSNTPAIPTIIFGFMPENFCRAQTIASNGFVIHITNALGQ